MGVALELLVVALSGRALAASARRAGMVPHVIDGFADSDTAAQAASLHRLPLRGGGLDGEALLHVLTRYPAGIPLCPGAGLEDQPELIAALERRGPWLGSPASAYSRVKQPQWLFPLLADLGVPHPSWSLSGPPPGAGPWLLKRIGGCGGGHVQDWHGGAAPAPGHYLQRRLPGRSLSALMLADGRDNRVLGFNEIWTAPAAEAPYRYGGAVRLPRMSAGVQKRIEELAAALVEASGLRGLWGLDFLLAEDGGIAVLEINPRPTATVELHEGRGSLLPAHRAACEGRGLTEIPRPETRVRAQAILYSERNWTVPWTMVWPQWTADRPVPGSRLPAGGPVCSAFAEGEDPATARRRVELRLQHVARLFGLPPASPDAASGARRVFFV